MTFGEGARIRVIGGSLFGSQPKVSYRFVCLDMQGSREVVLRRGRAEVAINQAIGTVLRRVEENEAQGHRQREANRGERGIARVEHFHTPKTWSPHLVTLHAQGFFGFSVDHKTVNLAAADGLP